MSTHKITTKPREVEAKLQSLLGHDHVVVRPYGRHLLVQLVIENKPETIARLTTIQANLYHASFRTHNGRWEQLPGEGNLLDMTTLLVDMLRPYFEINNY